MRKIYFLFVLFLLVIGLSSCSSIITIIFDTNGGTPIEPMKIKKEETLIIPITKKEGYDFVGWYLDSEFSNEYTKDTKLENDSILYAKWHELPYRVLIDFDNGNSSLEQYIDKGKWATRPQDPIKNGYNFVGWVDEDNKPFDFSTPITKQRYIKAVYEKINKCMVTFETNGGSTVEPMAVNVDSTITLPLTIKANSIFSGWYLDNELTSAFDESMKVESDITLYAKWMDVEGITYYTISFDSDNGSPVFEEIVEENHYPIKPTNPSKEGYMFVNWIKEDGTVFNFNTRINANVSLKALYDSISDEKYVVTFEANGGSILSSLVVEASSTIYLPLSIKEGYVLVGWYLNDDFTLEFDPATPITKDITLYALWKEVELVDTFTVTFDPANGDDTYSVLVIRGEKMIKPESPQMAGMAFVCWVNTYDNQPFSFNTKVEDNYNLKATYQKIEEDTCIVSFNTNGGTALDNVIVKKGEALGSATEPYLSGYRLVSWCIDVALNVKFDLNTPINSNITLYAKWERIEDVEKYSVVFLDYDGTVLPVLETFSIDGNLIYTQYVEKGDAAITPLIPERDGYRFAGWDKDYSSVEENLEIKAVYVKAYTVSFYEDSNLIVSEIVDFGMSATAPTPPEKFGYRFVGWDKSLDFIVADTIIRAIYIERFNVIFNDYDGTTLSDAWYDKGEAIIAPNAPTYEENIAFNGWDKTFDKAESSIIITATTKAKTYVVNFYDYDNTLIDSQTIYPGEDATAPDMEDKIYIGWDAQFKKGYRFAGWDKDYTKVESNLNVKAVYEVIKDPVIYVETEEINQGTKEVEVSIYLISSTPLRALYLEFKYDSHLSTDESMISTKNHFSKPSQYNISLDKQNNECSFSWFNVSSITLSDNYVEVMVIKFNLDKYVAKDSYIIDVLDTAYLTNDGINQVTPIVIDGEVIVK